MTNTPETQITDHLGMTIPSALPIADDQEIALLRTLGRLELMTVEQCRVAFFPSMTERGVRDRLDRMQEAGVVWRTKCRYMPVARPMGRGRSNAVAASGKREYLQHPYVYGLTDEGKELLNTLEVEQDVANLSRLRSRDPREKAPPDARTIGHDLQVSWWVLNVVLEASRNRLCRAVYAQVEFISEARQRIDALIILRLSPNRPRKVEDIGPIPWFDGTPRADDEIDVRLALEVDRGTEPLPVLLRKGAAYRDLTFNGSYTKLLGGPVLPVFLVQSDDQTPLRTVRRARQIAAEFRAIWSQGWGVISTPAVVTHKEAGALWGRYQTLVSDAAFPLLTELRVAPDGRTTFEPVCDLDTWMEHRVLVPVQHTPEQLAGQTGGRRRRNSSTEEEAEGSTDRTDGEGFRMLEADAEEAEDAEGVEDAESAEEAEDADAAA